MKAITLGLLALFAVAISSGVVFADCAPGHATKTSTTVASTDGSTPVVVPTSKDGG